MNFEAGDLCLLIDGKDRRYMFTLDPKGLFHSHHGPLPHSDIIGQPEAVEVYSEKRRKFRAYRPTLADYILKMPRGAQVVYPKDIGPILVHADIFPGSRVLESGTGSGALTLALMRAAGPKGTIFTFERREEFRDTALKNIQRFAGSDPGYATLESALGDMYEDVIDIPVDRVVFDLTEPWLALDNVRRCLEPGGILIAYMPTVTQVARLGEALDNPGWDRVKTFETMHRGWNVDGLSVRPDHRMVAHTAFLTVARKLSDPVPEAE